MFSALTLIDARVESRLSERLALIYKGRIWGKKRRAAACAIELLLAHSDDEIKTILARSQ